MKRRNFSGAFAGMASWPQFSYKKQLREAIDAVRWELDTTVHSYVSRFPAHDYRKLARRLKISPAKLCEILSQFPPGRKRGRRKAQRTAQPNHSVPPRPRSIPVPRQIERKDVDQALSVLYLCVVNGRVDHAGDGAYQNLTDWLRKPQDDETLRTRAGYLTQRYEALRSRTNSSD
jgi:hypothetical protein